MSRKILVVEDNETNMYLIRYILTQAGYEVLEARSGEEGVTAVEKEKPDLVIMDIQLPGIDGLEATRMIRALGAEITIPVVALTAHAMTGDREKALEAGCTGYIEKPIDPAIFKDQIRGYLEG